MPTPIRLYVKYIEALNRFVGRLIMYFVFVMMGILLLSSGSRGFFNVSFIWVVEISQFLLAGYYLLGGGYSMQLNAHVRMDLLYSRWSTRGQAFADSITAFCLVFYLIVLFMGGISSTEYALQYGQRNYSAWAPPLAPIKIVMTIGIALMLLQVIAIFFRDLATVTGKPIE